MRKDKTMSKKSNKSQLLVLLTAAAITAIFFIGCKNQNTREVRETATSGNIKIEADESFKPIVDAQISTFTSLYINAHVTPVYKSEKEMIADFLNDSVKVLVTAWTPNEEQIAFLSQTRAIAKTTVVAYDALALVMNKANNDSLLTYKNVQDIFTGKVTDWKQINPKSKLGRINIVFDNEHSCNIRYFKELFQLPDQLPSNFYAVNNNPEVIDYVSKSPDALGIVSVNWISDRDDSLSVNFTDKIKVAGISQQYLEPGTYYRPEQGAIYDRSYAFVRSINMVSRESIVGLGTGFVAWVAGEKGQRIILKSGLVPATMPIRLINAR